MQMDIGSGSWYVVNMNCIPVLELLFVQNLAGICFLTLQLSILLYSDVQPMVLEWVMDASPPGTDPSLTNNDGSGGGGCQNRYDSNDSFYWFRFILFTLLIALPCLRAGYIWWAGGGRIQLRQDPETGRITGLQYIPPMQNWFGIVYHHHHGSQDQTPVHDPLTEEQVMVLPEIAFRLAEANEHNSHCEKTSSEAGKGMHKSSFHIPKDENMIENSKAHNIESTGCHPDNSLVVSNAPMLREETLQLETPNLDSTEISIPPLDVVPINPDALSMIGNATAMSADESLDKEQLPKTNRTSSGGPSSNFTTTTCTTCSICIDEFVDGECLRLLPRCGHAFHTECILPWLSKRQGCCPLCKMAVLATVDSEDKEESCQNGDDAAGSLAPSSVQEPEN
jgi:Ring finger domain